MIIKSNFKYLILNVLKLIMKIIPLAIITLIVILIFIALFRQKIRLSKERTLLDAQDKKIKEMNSKQSEIGNYRDFTDGHMYQ